MKEKITIEIDTESLKEELKQQAINRVVRGYFDADDIYNYDERQKERAKRLEKVIGEVDWNKLPEEMQRGILKEFIQRYVLRGS